jgi:hypothetical protein
LYLNKKKKKQKRKYKEKYFSSSLFFETSIILGCLICDDACHAAIGKGVGTDGGFSRQFIFRRPLQPAAVFDTSSIFIFRAPHLSLCRYGLLSPGHEHLPCASIFFLYFDFLHI